MTKELEHVVRKFLEATTHEGAPRFDGTKQSVLSGSSKDDLYNLLCEMREAMNWKEVDCPFCNEGDYDCSFCADTRKVWMSPEGYEKYVSEGEVPSEVL